MEYTLYHVTNSLGLQQIMSKSFQIKLPLIVNTGGRPVKPPGSLGYGLYTFEKSKVDTEQIALTNFGNRLFGTQKFKII
ncbi:hypothetical protein [Lentilactobacillus otakiensis]|uniref:hypothetical protein n=1 Tax=Lentilactobacillus otakiensis TaxID=481720 RepID=UPI003D181DA9